MTTVVNLRQEPYDVYIGRSGHGVKGPYGNWYSHMPGTLADYRCQTRAEAIHLHMLDLRTMPRQELIEFLKPLVGKRLGCFCKPKACHGDNYVMLIHELGLE